MYVYGQLIRAAVETLSADPSTAADKFTGRLWYNTATNLLKYSNAAGTVKALVTSGDIVDADINASAAITYTKLAISSTVSAVELGYVTGVTSAIQTQLDAKQLRSTLTAKGDLYVATASNVVTRQGIGADGSVLTADSAQTNGLKWATPSTAPDESSYYSNGSLAAAVGSSALTISLKDAAGSDPSAGSAVKIAFRSATAATGTYTVVSATAALSVVVSSGSTLGMLSGATNYIYVYAINNAGAIELAVSSVQWDEGTRQSTTAEGGAGAADSNRVLYSTTARTNVGIRLIGRLKVTEATAGTWATAPSEISNIPFIKQTVSCFYSRSTTTVGTSATTLLITSKNHDTHNAYDTSTGIFTVPERGLYKIYGKIYSATAVSSSSVDQTVDVIALHSGSFGSINIGHFTYQVSSVSLSPHATGSVVIPCEAGDTLKLQAARGANISSFTGSSNENTYIGITKVGEIL